MNYTLIEQSKRLFESGLNPETADMYYDLLTGDEYPQPVRLKLTNKHWMQLHLDVLIPCWSLGALMELLPPYIFDFERGIDLNIYRNLNGKGWHVSYMPNNIESMKKDKFKQITNGKTPTEAVYNMVCWLLENGIIKG